jgi:hypothetical protein
MQSKPKVCVIADSTDQEKGRTCFWGLLKEQLGDIEITVESFVDCRNEGRFLDFSGYDCIVFSWDVLNNDHWMHGEVTQAMTARAAREFLPDWVKAGGLLILEAQACHWAPSQEAYDCVLPKSGLTVRKYGYHRTKNRTSYRIVRRHEKHPFLKGLGLALDKDYECVGDTCDTHWFPDWYKTHAQIRDALKQRTHSGTFLAHKPEWLPLLVCSNERLPIMLATVRGNGAIVATTMYLGSSGDVSLINNLISNWKRPKNPELMPTEFMRDVLDYHKKVRRRELIRYSARRFLLSFFLSILPAVGCYLGIKYFGVYAGPVGGLVVGILLCWKYYHDLARVFIEKFCELSQWISRFRGGG